MAHDFASQVAWEASIVNPVNLISFVPYALYTRAMDIKTQKTRARVQAKARRQSLWSNSEFDAGLTAFDLCAHFPAPRFQGAVIAGYWPLIGEIDPRPLLRLLSGMGHQLALPCTPRKGHPLIFRAWHPDDALKAGPYNTREPLTDKPEIRPDVLLMPLLAFTPSGERLGYGGGFYDRTLARLRSELSVFACGVGFAAQEAASLPIGPHDGRLDGILTELYFKDTPCA